MEIVATDLDGLTIYLSEREYFALARPQGLLDRELKSGGPVDCLNFTLGPEAVALHMPLSLAEKLIQGIAGHIVDAVLKRIVAAHLSTETRSHCGQRIVA